MAVQRGRSERARRRLVPWRYVESSSDARTTLAAIFSILLEVEGGEHPPPW